MKQAAPRRTPPSGRRPRTRWETALPRGETPLPSGETPFPSGETPFPSGETPFPSGGDPFPQWGDPFPSLGRSSPSRTLQLLGKPRDHPLEVRLLREHGEERIGFPLPEPLRHRLHG